VHKSNNCAINILVNISMVREYVPKFALKITGKYTTNTMEDMGNLGGVNYKNWEMIKQKVIPDVFKW